MAKLRVVLFILTLTAVLTVGTFVAYYARGYRFNLKTFKFSPNGILVIKSEPDGASVYVNGDLKTATNTTLPLSPGNYDIEVKKDGYFTWYKRLAIDKEIVTQANISLFKNVPSLSPITISGAENPVISSDGTKIAYVIPPGKDVPEEKVGLWTLDTYNLPLGFSNDPKRLTDGNLKDASYFFSPDDRQIMLTTSEGIYVLDTGSFTSQNQRINVAAKKDLTLAIWQNERNAKDSSLVKNLPPEMTNILERKTSDFIFSPDQNLILYTASSSGNLPEKLITQLPGASTQKQERTVQPDHTYIYDIKEDRNFLVIDTPIQIQSTDYGLQPTENSLPAHAGQQQTVNGSQSLPALRWMPTSRHLLLSEPGKISIMDYDGTNKQIVYAGSYIAPYAFPFNNTTRLLILTNLGGDNSTPNLYTVTIK